MAGITTIEAVANAGPFAPTWESLAHNQAPSWFADAKFGIFTHWGLYTVPEYRNEWYSRNMYIQGYPEFDHHRATYGPQNEFGYKDFIPMFRAEAFDADEWASLFARAGARYIMPVSEHHDGFQMYRSALSHWNSMEMGPHRDVLGELRTAATHAGLHFCTSNHRAEHWWFMGHGREFDSDVREPMRRGDFYWPAMPEPNEFDTASEPAPTAEYLEDWLLRVAEVIDNYEPELLYFDWWIQHRAFAPYLKTLAAYYYNRAAARGAEASICYKYDALAWGAGIVDVERGGFTDPTPFVWQTDTAIARNSWCYTDSLDYKTLPELVVALIDAVSNNGNLLLNVGPRADGSIAEHDRALLEGMTGSPPTAPASTAAVRGASRTKAPRSRPPACSPTRRPLRGPPRTGGSPPRMARSTASAWRRRARASLCAHRSLRSTAPINPCSTASSVPSNNSAQAPCRSAGSPTACTSNQLTAMNHSRTCQSDSRSRLADLLAQTSTPTT